MNKRIFFVDFLKALGISFVVFGHIWNDRGLTWDFIYSFHVPLFFYLSGIFYIKSDLTFSSFIKRRLSNLVFPYLFFYILTYAYWVFIESSLRTESGGVSAEWWRPLVGLIWGGAEWNLFAHNRPLWFIPSLFVIEMMAWLLRNKDLKTNLFIFCILLIGQKYLSYNRISLPWGAIQAIQYYIFYITGRTCFHLTSSKYHLHYLSGSIIAYFAIVFCLGYTHNYLPSTINPFEIIKFYSIAFLFVIILTLLFESVFRDNNGGNSILFKTINFYGKNTLCILCIHDPIKRAVIFLYSKISCHTIDHIRSDYFDSFICFILLMVILIPFVKIYNRKVKPYLRLEL